MVGKYLKLLKFRLDKFGTYTTMSRKTLNTEHIVPERIPSHSPPASATILLKYLQKQFDYVKTKNVLFFYLILILVWIWANQDFFEEQLSIKTQSLDQFLIDALEDLQKQMPEKYIGIEEIKIYDQLPLCVVVDKDKWELNDKFIKSIRNQQYSNYKTVVMELEKPKTPPIQNQNYLSLQQILKKQCDQKSILLFMERPLANQAFSALNNYYQTYNAWITYTLHKNQEGGLEGIELLSTYTRVFDFIGSNDFSKFNKQLLQRPLNSLFLITSLFQLCKFYSLPIPENEVFVNQQDKKGNLNYYQFGQNTEWEQKYRRKPYQALHSLAQNYKIANSLSLNSKRKLFMRSNSTITQKMGIFDRDSMISHSDMRRALQFQQSIYLPKEHSLNLLEIKMMEEKFQIGRFVRNELPLCININSHNNIQNERYKKVLDSVTAQNYTNYQIVFIDDMSDDGTLAATKKYLEGTLNFPRERVTYVKNKVHTYATYNIINAAFNFCKNDSIQVLVDGDDQLIGKQVFKLISAEYQKQDLWVMYTFYKSDKYDEGISIPFKGEYLRGFFGGRKLIHYFGPTRTFKVNLIKKVPLNAHLNQRGQFLDTMYDTALEYPLFEMSGPNHSKFVNYTSYLYFSGYGANDDSNIFKKIRRIALNIYVSMRQPLEQLDKLYENTENEEVPKILKQGAGKIYEEIN